MTKFRSFEDIKAWQHARELNVEIYKITAKGIFSTDYGLRDQIRRASVSISSNIAEGFERESTKDFLRFLYIAKASAAEVRSQLYLAFDLQYLTDQEFEELKARASDISKILSGLIKYLKSTL